MKEVPITLVMKDLDTVAPLACGDVPVNGIALHLDRDTPRALERPMADPNVDAGELSLSRHVLRLASSDFSWVALPVFVYRGFRQRCFYVRRGSELTSLEQLRGKRIGTNEWPASGNVWTKALLREAGVALDTISWHLGPVDEPAEPRRPQGILPAYCQVIPPDRCLSDLLMDGALDALMVPRAPRGFYQSGGGIVRLFADYRAVEAAYYRRAGFYPGHHIIGVRRHVYEANPWVLRSLFDALEQSRLLWQQRRSVWAECTPWYLAELEEVTALMGEDWQPNGVAANLRMVNAFCQELHAQGLIAHPQDGAAVFAEFEEVMKHQPA
jgi:4,5-dihydroxyphthalate decarboxylase